MNVWNKEHRGQGFWFYELALIVVILGILVVLSIPIYSSIVSRAREEVGAANARILNIGVGILETMHPEKLPAVPEQTALVQGRPHRIPATAAGTYNPFYALHKEALLDFLDLADVEYVAWSLETERYVSDPDSDGIRRDE